MLDSNEAVHQRAHHQRHCQKCPYARHLVLCGHGEKDGRHYRPAGLLHTPDMLGWTPNLAKKLMTYCPQLPRPLRMLQREHRSRRRVFQNERILYEPFSHLQPFSQDASQRLTRKLLDIREVRVDGHTSIPSLKKDHLLVGEYDMRCVAGLGETESGELT